MLVQYRVFTAETPLSVGREDAEEKYNRAGRLGEENDLGTSSGEVFVWDGLQFTS